MLRKTNIQTNQKVSTADFESFGDNPRESFDATIKDLGDFIAPRYSGFQVEQTGASELRVGTGRMYKSDGSVFGYDAEGGATIDLLDDLPAVAKRIATVVVYGNTINTDLQPRTFLTDVTTRKTEGREVAVESRRQAYVGKLLGQENATPTAPAVNADYVAVAHVVLTPAGIEEITPLTANRVITLRGLSERASSLESFRRQAGSQIETLRTDISALGSRLRTKADSAFVSGIAIDVARVKDIVELPDDYAAYGADRFLTKDETNEAAPDYNARVHEGIRFPSAAEKVVPLNLQNAIENRVMTNDSMMLPRWSETTRLSMVGQDGEYPLTTTTVETVNMVRRTETRTVRNFLGSQLQCTNSRWWREGEYDAASGIFRRNGETFEVENVEARWIAVLEAGNNGLSHWVRVNRYVEETVSEQYWDRVVENEEVVGSVCGQTFLNSQDGYLTGVDFFVTKRANAGPVRVVICETKDGWEPDVSAVIASKQVDVSDINVYPAATGVNFKPTFLTKGKRYAVVFISAGAHFLATIDDNVYSQGAFLQRVNGQWQEATTGRDAALRMRFASFDRPVITVGLEPLELAGGIDSIMLNADATIPDGTELDFRVLVGGQWRSLRDGAEGVHILQSRPSLVQFQVVFVGTTDVMPALGITDDRSQITLHRPSSTLTHVSTPRMMPAPVNQIEITLQLENWDFDEHSADVSIGTGDGYATTVAPDAVTVSPSRNDPNASVLKASFVLDDPIENFTIRTSGATNGSGEYFHVAERTDLEFAV